MGTIMEKSSRSISCNSAAAVFAIGVAVLWGLPASAQQTTAQPQVLRNAVVNEAIKFDVSEPLTEMAQAANQAGVRVVVHPMLQPKLHKLDMSVPGPSAAAAVRNSPGPLVSASVGLGFEGIG